MTARQRGYFNSRPSARGDARHRAHVLVGGQFQFTPLREGRRIRSRPCAQCTFQFTPLREGRPGSRDRACSNERISIHAPPRGATSHVGLYAGENALFQFTPLREGRPGNPAERRNNHISIHAPPRGATKSPGRTPGGSHISIHAPPRGATMPVPS